MKTKRFLLQLLFSLGLLLGSMESLGQTMQQRRQPKTRPAQQAATRPSSSGQRRGFQTVKVTGKGETLEKAREDAKTLALAQVVGEAVRARTEVKEENDKASVLSQILTASAGFIAKFEELSTANNDGIFSVTANVTVYSEKLLEAVTFGNSSAEVDKEMQEAKVGSDIEETREKMTRYISSYMLDYGRIWNVTVKELLPGYDNKGQAILQVNGYFGTTPEKYRMYIARLNRALGRIGAKQAEPKHELHRNFIPVYYCIRPDNQSNGDYGGKGWAYLWLAKKFLEEPRSFEDEFKKYGYKFTFQLLDEDGEIIKTHEEGFFFSPMCPFPIPRERYGLGLVALLNEHRKTCFRRKCNFTFKDFASSEDMLRVKRIAVQIDTVKMVREPTLKFHQYFHRDTTMHWGWIEH